MSAYFNWVFQPSDRFSEYPLSIQSTGVMTGSEDEGEQNTGEQGGSLDSTQGGSDNSILNTS